MATALDHLSHLRLESARFAEALDLAPSSSVVPTCPDWNADDLLWHLAEVQFFWGTIVRDRLADPSAAEEAKPPRPTDRAGLRAFFDTSSTTLIEALDRAPDDAPVWTWAADHSAGFVRRRQAHEALIHRIDAELTAGSRTPMDTGLSADGVDEVLRVMYGGAPDWGTFTPYSAQTVRVAAADTGQTWVLTLGRFVGSDPDGGEQLDVPDLRVAELDDGSPAAADIRGTAADLDCWFWHRPTVDEVELTGDEAVLTALAATIADGID